MHYFYLVLAEIIMFYLTKLVFSLDCKVMPQSDDNIDSLNTNWVK